MEITFYLVQHGESKSKEQDPERRLTEKGIEESRKVANYLLQKGEKLEIIIHSGKTRARETAEIYAEYLKPEKGVSQGEKLSPLDNPYFWAEKLKNENKSTMLVGHLPHLSKLLSLLITGNSDIEIVKFRYSCCIAILKEKEDFAVKWFITPEII